MLVHNGLVRSYKDVRRAKACEISEDLYPSLEGTTDSEWMFFFAITIGLLESPIRALQPIAGFVEQIGRSRDIAFPLQMTPEVADGTRLLAVRYSSEGQSRTLYHSKNLHAFSEIHPEAQSFPQDARCVVSEPLSDLVASGKRFPSRR